MKTVIKSLENVHLVIEGNDIDFGSSKYAYKPFNWERLCTIATIMKTPLLKREIGAEIVCWKWRTWTKMLQSVQNRERQILKNVIYWYRGKGETASEVIITSGAFVVSTHT